MINIYELSSLQQGIVFHSLYAPESGTFVVQFCCTLTGKLNIIAFEQAWQQVIERHDILRTSFHWEELEKPLQIVHPRVSVPLEQYDWCDLPSQEQQKQQEEFLKCDRQQGFNFAEPPLMRLTLIRLEPETYVMIWTKHHLILDGWSTAKVLQQVFQSYESLLSNREQPLFRSYPYQNYIAWLQKQDLLIAEQFWRKTLKGFTSPTSLTSLPPLSRAGLFYFTTQNSLTSPPNPLSYEARGNNFYYLGTTVKKYSPFPGREGRQRGLGVPPSRATAVGWGVRSFKSRSTLDKPPLSREVEGIPNEITPNQPQTAPKPTYHRKHLELSLQTTETLQSLAKQNRLTLNTIVQGAYALLLSRYSGQEDVLFGAVVSGRPAELEGVESMIGLFINTLPVRVQVSPEMPLISWLKQLQSQQLELRQYEYSPLVQVQGWSEIPRGTPLFDSIIIFENYPVDRSALSTERSLEVTKINSLEQPTYPLEIMAVLNKQLSLIFGFDCRYFDTDLQKRILEQLQTLLETIATHPSGCLKDISLLNEAQKQQLLMDWNNTATDYPLDRSFPTLFETQAEQTPEAVAIIWQDQHLTYRELNQRANQLAHTLKKRGIGAGDIVGLCLERSLDVVIGLLGILKAGGAYLPIDITYPKDRIEFIIQDTQIPLLLTQKAIINQLPQSHAEIICLDTDWQPIHQESSVNLPQQTTSEDLAYIIYTSGSTGKPKGVQIPHRALTNFLMAMRDLLQITNKDTWLSVTTIAFDIAALELYLPLIMGARVVIASREVATDGVKLSQHLAQTGATIMQGTPATWKLLIAANWQGNPNLKMLSGGEALPLSLARQLLERGGELWNLYGPTESTIWSTACQIKPEDEVISIGRPIANTQIYILDRHLHPLPIGVSGDLYIGGQGVAKGYLNRPELTAEKFIANPFTESPIYKTGDIARYLNDGRIEYLGRSDRQVKLRGYRLELGEIEAVLNTHEAVKEGIILLKKDRLAAYIIPYQNPINIQNIRSFLQQKLPHYMIPSEFILLSEMPLTPNNKIDYQTLFNLKTTQTIEQPSKNAPQTPTEEKLLKIWLEILKLNSISIDDNFFELGGHSLLAMKINERIRETFQLDLPLRTLFEAPTIAQLAQKIENHPKNQQKTLENITPISRQARTAKMRTTTDNFQ